MDRQTYLTKEGFEKIKSELEELKAVKRKTIARRIQEAKELGDLSENAEYAEAKNEQSFVEGRIAELEATLKNATIIEKEKLNTTIVEVGNKLELQTPDKSVREYIIVGSNEVDPEKGFISNESPLGKALLGKKVGESVELDAPGGKSAYTVKSIT